MSHSMWLWKFFGCKTIFRFVFRALYLHRLLLNLSRCLPFESYALKASSIAVHVYTQKIMHKLMLRPLSIAMCACTATIQMRTQINNFVCLLHLFSIIYSNFVVRYSTHRLPSFAWHWPSIIQHVLRAVWTVLWLLVL